jgi:hypothetical protein
MLLAFIFILIIVWLGILLSVYSMFLPFFENLHDIINYNISYYWAVSSIERWLLITKYQQPGFEWSWWWINDTVIGPQSDFKIWDLGRIQNENNSSYRKINSRTTQIPTTSWWNINYLLAAADSPNFNKIWYNTVEKLLLSIDQTDDTEDYYTNDGNTTNYLGSYIEWTLRLPPKIFQKFWSSPNGLLCNNPGIPNCDANQDNIFDDIAVQRSLNWTYTNNLDFLIIPYTHVFLNQNPATIDTLYDSNIRENTINYATQNNWFANLEFSETSKYNPIQSNITSFITGHNIISQDTTQLKEQSFKQIINSSTDVSLQFGLGPLLKSQNWNIYPFLEYQFQFSEPISDRFYHIYWIWEIGSYKVEIILQKPTSDQDLSSDFTILF